VANPGCASVVSQRHVRPATIDDVPAIHRFCRRLFGSGQGVWGSDDCTEEIRQATEALLDISWQHLIEAQVPFLIGKEGSDVVGLATAWAEQLKMIFVYPH
jgi:hypothetical protein